MNHTETESLAQELLDYIVPPRSIPYIAAVRLARAFLELLEETRQKDQQIKTLLEFAEIATGHKVTIETLAAVPSEGER